jgi:hypothetical protein
VIHPARTTKLILSEMQAAFAEQRALIGELRATPDRVQKRMLLARSQQLYDLWQALYTEYRDAEHDRNRGDR